VGSLAVHLGATAALAILPALHPRKPPIHDAWVVGLAAALPAPAASQGNGAFAAPAPATPSSAGVRLDPPKPPQKPEDRKKAKEKNDKKERDLKDVKPQAPSALPAPSGLAAPAGPRGGTAPGVGAAGGTGVFASNIDDAQFAWYRASVVAALASRWIRPVLEGVRDPLAVTVVFDVDRDGTLRNIDVESSSGVPSLDRSALRAVADASPLPPLPSGWGQPPFAARFEFRWTPGNP
jgi:protein TonB